MKLQGKEAPHDFLSLYTKDSSFQQQDPRPPPSQGFSLETHDFLRPLEKAEKGRGGFYAAAAGGPTDRTAERATGHVDDRGSRGEAKPDRGECRVVRGFGLESKPEVANGSYVPYGGVPFTLWGNGNSSATESRSQGQWPSPFAALGSLSSDSRRHPERKRVMETPSRSSRGFDDDDDDDEDEFSRKEAPSSSQKAEVAVKIDGKGSGSDQRPNTPKSKHSATEQRRRSKINDRFQILRELIPHSDNKRDKASFLLEVIEYIQFLQEKVHKNELIYPGRNRDYAKLTSWKSSQFMGDGISDPSHVIKAISAPPGCLFTGRLHDNCIPSTPGVVSGANSLTETKLLNGVSHRAVEPPSNFANSITSQSQAQWLRSYSVANCAISSKMLKEQGEMTIDEGTINLSSSYSQELLTTLSEALRSSGVDLSRASMSVQINLRKRANSKSSSSATAATSIPKDHKSPGSSTNRAVGQSGGKGPQAPKRHKSDNN